MSETVILATAGSKAPVDVDKRVFYRTDDDSSVSNCLRTMRFGCCNPRYVITTESVKIEEWRGCSRVNDSVDIDDIQDMNLLQHMGFGYCCANHGNIKLYIHEVRDGKQTDRTKVISHIENAPAVFDKFASHIYKTNNMKFGMKRPELKDMPHIVYDSTNDPGMLKCVRTVMCCGCWLFPVTTITKERITTVKWTATCTKETLQFDLDHAEEVKLNRGCFESCCCGAGTLRVTGKDKDQDGVTIKFVGNSKKVFNQLDNYVNILNNRNRVLGDDGMKR